MRRRRRVQPPGVVPFAGPPQAGMDDLHGDRSVAWHATFHTNWMIDSEARMDRLDLPGIDTKGQWTARATQVGEHLHIALDGGDLYLAWTTLDDLAGQDVPI